MPNRSNSSLLAQAPSSSLGFSRRTNPQPKCYSKPWRQESSSLVIKRLGSLEKKAGKYIPVLVCKKVGNFFSRCKKEKC